MDYYFGVDVSKGYADFVLLSDRLSMVEPSFQLDDTASGHEQLKNWLGNFFSTHVGAQLNCGVESTGGFENNWYSFFIRMSTEFNLRIARLNPATVKFAMQATLNPNKTDSESAHAIACYLMRYSDQVDYAVQDNQYTAFRSFHNHIVMTTKQKTQLINEMKQLLYSCFPDLQRFCKQGIPNWVLELIQEYPNPQKLAKAKPEKVAKIKGITLQKATQLIQKAAQTIASRTTSTDGILLCELAEEIRSKTERCKRLKAHLEKQCTGPEMELLTSIKGIGAYSAAVLMIQIEDIRRFSSPKALASYFGLHPVIKQSGDKKAVSKMSKKGRPAIRALLFMCANSAVLADKHLRAIYAAHRAKGKNHKQALGVIMHKLLRIIWGVLAKKTLYDAQIDQSNRSKPIISEGKSEKNMKNNKRQHQKYDLEAPISRIEQKKRKTHAASQAGHAGQVRDLEHESAENI